MRERFSFLVFYFLFWLVFFISSKIIFLTYHHVDVHLLLVKDLWGIFRYGVEMDIAIVGYICVIPFLLVGLSPLIKKSWLENTLYTYTFIMVFLVSLITVIDLEVYNIWKFRIDVTPLSYLKSPKEAFVSVKSSPIFQLFLSFLALILLSSFIIYRIISNYLNRWKSIPSFPFILYGIVIWLTLIIPIRGGFGAATMNQSRVFFSQNNFANIASINPSWNFFSSLLKNKSTSSNPYTYLPREVIDRILRKLFRNSTSKSSQIYIKPVTEKPNVLIIIWEGCSAKALDSLYQGKEILPNLNKIKNESIFFSKCYANGERTDKGLLAILSAYPPQPNTSIISDVKKSNKLQVLSQDFENRGYSSEFYYGGNAEFANMKSYLFNANFRKIISELDFDKNIERSDWGIYDKDLFEKFLDDHKKQTGPYFSTMLTLSSHEPYDVPFSYFTGKETKDLYFNSLAYTDNEFGKFIENAKLEKWWNNTLIIVLADHGKTQPKTGKRIDDFKIPMIWTGGVVKQPFVCKQVISQLDIAATLSGQLKQDSKSYSWSKNIFAKDVQSWAFMVFNDGFGFVEKEKYVLFNNETKKILEANKDMNTEFVNKGKALQQATFEDYLSK